MGEIYTDDKEAPFQFSFQLKLDFDGEVMIFIAFC